MSRHVADPLDFSEERPIRFKDAAQYRVPLQYFLLKLRNRAIGRSLEIIRRFAQKDPATHYLVQIEGHHRESFEGKGDIPIKMHNGMKFQVISIGPTPVSDVNVTGPEAFSRGLVALGYRPEQL